MVINKDLYLKEVFNIKLRDELLIKLEDAVKNKDNLLIVIEASHYGFLNKNSVIYNHVKMKDCINSFVYPNTKPIIRNHRPTESQVFGKIVAAEYKKTKYYESFHQLHDIDNMDSFEYIKFCKDTIIPFQNKHPEYNGLAYTEVVGNIDNTEGIKKILDKEFFHVSIGAIPKRMICSSCLQDQMVNMCEHYPKKGGDIFMLADSLEYEELSFVNRPADKFGKIIQILDGEEVEYEVENDKLESSVDLILAKDFFKIADGKKIVCMDNICKVINAEEETNINLEDTMDKNQKQEIMNISFLQEFPVEKLKEVKLTDSEEEINLEEALKLEDEESLTNKDFALTQKTSEGTKRRFPINSESNVKVALALIDSAEDVTDSEREKAKTAITKAAKKLGIEIKVADKEEDKEDNKEDDKLQSICDSIKEYIESVDETKLTDSEAVKPMSFLFGTLSQLGTSIKWAGEDLKQSLDSFLKSLGQIAVEKGQYDSLNDTVTALTDEVKEAKEEIELLDEQNRTLNYELRASLVDEIIELKRKLEVLDSEETEKTTLMKTPYESLTKQVSDYRKLSDKLKDSTVNNKTEVTTIKDPTLADSIGDKTEDQTNTNVDNLQDEVKATPEELVQAFINLFRR